MIRWVAFVSVGVGLGASQRIPLSVLARIPHKGLVREISYETGIRRGKARSQGNEEKAVNRREQKSNC